MWTKTIIVYIILKLQFCTFQWYITFMYITLHWTIIVSDLQHVILLEIWLAKIFFMNFWHFCLPTWNLWEHSMLVDGSFEAAWKGETSEGRNPHSVWFPPKYKLRFKNSVHPFDSAWWTPRSVRPSILLSNLVLPGKTWSHDCIRSRPNLLHPSPFWKRVSYHWGRMASKVYVSFLGVASCWKLFILHAESHIQYLQNVSA